MFSTFTDGSGMLFQPDGTTLPGWRDFERATAVVVDGIATEGKDVFDVIIPVPAERIAYGISLKSKEQPKAKLIDGTVTFQRAHLEISNSSAKFWSALNQNGIYVKDFRDQLHAAKIGTTLVDLVNSWYKLAAKVHLALPPGFTLDIKSSVHLTVSYSKDFDGEGRYYQMHSFDVFLPTKLDWKHVSSKCLRGYDPQDGSLPLIEW